MKEYRSHTGQGVTVHLGPLRRAEYHYVMNDGPFKGRDPRDLADEAIAWLEEYLDRIDSLGA